MTPRRVVVLCFLATLFFFNRAKAESPADSLEKRINNAIEQNHVVNQLGHGFQNSPCGEFLLAPQNGDLRFGILIYNIDIFPDKAVFSAGIAFRDHRSNQLIAFHTNQVKFSHSHGITGEVKLYLMDSVLMNLGQSIKIQFNPGSEYCYAVFDCAGLREFSMNGYLSFNRNYVLPVNDTGAVIPTLPLKCEVSFKARKWSDIIAELSIPPFQIKGLNNFVFSLSRAILDLSETSNASGMFFPPEYSKMTSFSNDLNLWEGIALQSGSLTMPGYFRKGREKLKLEIRNLIIDDYGISTDIISNNILTFKDGMIGGWNLSIDELQLKIALNEIKSAGFKGKIGLPVLPDTVGLFYHARMDRDNNYLFTMRNENQLTFPVFNISRAEIARNSYVSIEIRDEKVLAHANLNGRMLFESKGSENNPSYKIPEIVFQGMTMSNRDPKFSIDQLGIVNNNDTSKIAGFPVLLHSLNYAGSGLDHTITLDVSMNLTEYIGARTTLKIVGKLSRLNERDKLVYKGSALSSLWIQFQKSGISVEGKVDIIKSDPDYGDGFGGNIQFSLSEPSIRAGARGLFGRKGNTRYWYFDAEAMWPAPGIPLFTGAYINGFIGGAWYHLSPWNGKSKIQNPDLGKTGSGVVLIPDANAGLGLKAGAFVNGGNGGTYQVKSVLETHFNRNGSVAKTIFYGDLELLTSNSSGLITDMSAVCAKAYNNTWENYRKNYKPGSQIGGPFMMQLDFMNQCFVANSAVYIKEAAGNTLNGGLGKFLAGEIQAYFSKNKWFIRLGQPQKTLSVNATVGTLTGVAASAYLIGGTELLPAPSPPVEIERYLGYRAKLDSDRSLDNIQSGRGLALGMALKCEANAGGSDKKVSVYANLLAKCAFDVSVKKYEKDIICSNSNATPGISGWFANGSLYAFVQGKLGASAGKFKMDVMTFTGAVRMDYKGPNPMHAVGKSFIEFNLGGLFKFKGSINISLGEVCNLESFDNHSDGILRSHKPGNGTVDFSPLGTPALNFNVPVNEPFIDDNGRKLMFSVSTNRIELNQLEVNGSWKWSDNHLSAVFTPSQALRPNQDYVWTVEIELLELKETGYIPVLFYGQKQLEKHRFQFRTGILPLRIPVENIKSAWPDVNQVNFYRNQTSSGFIILEMNQDYLFQVQGKKVLARFSSLNGTYVAETALSYKHGKLEFSIPQSLRGNQIYHLRIVQVDQNYIINTGSSASPGTSPVNQQAGLKNTASNMQQILLLEYHFRSSHFATFSEKINSFKHQTSLTDNRGIKVELTSSVNEYFELKELNTINGARIFVAAEIKGNQWYTAEIIKKVYSIFPTVSAEKLLNRKISEFGNPPVGAVMLHQQNIENVILTNENILQKVPVNYGVKNLEIMYNFPVIIEKDFQDIRAGLLELYLKNHPQIQKTIDQYLLTFSKHMGPSRPVTGTVAAGISNNNSIQSATLNYASAKANSSAASRLAALEFPALYRPSDYPLSFHFKVDGSKLIKNSNLNINFK